MKNTLLLIFLFFTAYLQAQNPIAPIGVYFADPSAKVWNDGRIYVYGSLDEDKGYYCSHKYYVLSSSDMKNWTVHKNVFFSKGENDQVAYSDEILYAPDAHFANNTYYLYYCLASNKNTEGVATSLSPTGPFKDGKILNTGIHQEIDPAVFTDEDKQVYYIWGQFDLKIAKMKSNMLEIDSNSIHTNVINEKNHYFHEGAFLTKRNGLYYLVYADISRANKPTSLGYATSKNIFGPYQYRGVIIDNNGCDPQVWNNHGSIVQFNDQWYVFYHRSSGNSGTLRKACVEPIYFNKDGSITEVEMTSQGAGKPLDAKMKIDAGLACIFHGSLYLKNHEGKDCITGMKSNDASAFKYVDFSNGLDSVSILVLRGKNGATINLTLDQPWSASIGMINIPGGGDGKTFETFSTKIKPTIGTHALWLKYWGGFEEEFLEEGIWFH